MRPWARPSLWPLGQERHRRPAALGFTWPMATSAIPTAITANPQSGCTNIRHEHGSSEEHQRDSNPEEQTLHDSTSIRP